MRKFYSKKSILGVAAVLMASAATPAFADEAESANGITVSGTAAVTSDYRFRGLSLSGGDAAVQASIEVAHESGFYAGTWGSSINGLGGTEIDAYAGWNGEVTSGVKADVGLLYYFYPATPSSGGFGATDYFEPYASLSTTVGPVEATVGVNYSWGGQAALGNNEAVYVHSELVGAIPNTPVSLNAHVGYTKSDVFVGVLSPVLDDEYFDWSLGADYAITDKLTAGLKYTDTDDKPAQQDFTDSSILFTLSVAF